MGAGVVFRRWEDAIERGIARGVHAFGAGCGRAGRWVAGSPAAVVLLLALLLAAIVFREELLYVCVSHGVLPVRWCINRVTGARWGWSPLSGRGWVRWP